MRNDDNDYPNDGSGDNIQISTTDILEGDIREVYLEESSDSERNQDIYNIEFSLKSDILYKLLEKEGFVKDIITPEMLKLGIGIYYNPDQASAMTGVNAGTMRSWLSGRYSIEIASYIDAIKRDKFYVLEAIAVFRIRLIHLVSSKLKYSLTQTGNIAVGKGLATDVKILPNDNSGKFDGIEEKIAKLEQQNELLVSIFRQTFHKLPDGQWALKQNLLGEAKTPEVDVLGKFEEIKNYQTESNKEIEKLVDEKISSLRDENKMLLRRMEIEREVRIEMSSGFKNIFKSKLEIEKQIDLETKKRLEDESQKQ